MHYLFDVIDSYLVVVGMVINIAKFVMQNSGTRCLLIKRIAFAIVLVETVDD